VPAVSLTGASREIVERERETAAARVDQLRREAEALRSLAAEVDEELRSSSRILQHAEELLGLAPQIPIDDLQGELRGRRLREIAIELLRSRRGERAEIHYREWLDLLQSTGARVGGKNPAATFLTQIASAPEVESVRPRSGRYRLKSTLRAVDDRPSSSTRRQSHAA
jgi:hypothetical protein